MDEELLNELFLYAQDKGYKGDLNNFKNMVRMDDPIQTNELFKVARGDSEYRMARGFAGGMDSFRGAIGLKKKEESQVQVMEPDAASVDANVAGFPTNVVPLPASDPTFGSATLEFQHSFNTRFSADNSRLAQEKERQIIFGLDNEKFDYNRFNVGLTLPENEVFTETQLLNEMNFNALAYQDIYNMYYGDIPKLGTKAYDAAEEFFEAIDDSPTRLAYLSSLRQSPLVVLKPKTRFKITPYKHTGRVTDVGGKQPTKDKQFQPETLGLPEEMLGIRLEGSMVFNGKITDFAEMAPASIKLTEKVIDANGNEEDRDYVGLHRFGIVNQAYYDREGYDDYWLGGEEFFPLTEFLDFSHKLNVMKAREQFGSDEDYIDERQAILNKEIRSGTVHATTMGGFVERGYTYKMRKQELFDLDHEYLQKHIQENDAVLKEQVLNWLPKSLSENEEFLQELDEDIFTHNPSLYFNLSGSGDLFEQWSPVDLIVNLIDGAYSDVWLPIVYGAAALLEMNAELNVEFFGGGDVDLGWSKAIREHQNNARQIFSGYWDPDKGRYVPGFKTLHKTDISDKLSDGNIMGAFGQALDVGAQATPMIVGLIGVTAATGGIGTAPAIASAATMGYLAAANEYMGNYEQYLTPEDRWDAALKIGGLNFGIGLAGFGLIRPKLGQISRLRNQGAIIEAEVLQHNINRRFSKILTNNLGPVAALGGTGGAMDAWVRLETMKGRGIEFTSDEEADMIIDGVYHGLAIGAFSNVAINFTLSRAFTNHSKFSLKMLELSELSTKDISKMSVAEVKAMLNDIPNPKHRAMVQEELIQFNIERLKIAGENDAVNKVLQLRHPDRYAEMTHIDFLLQRTAHQEKIMRRLGRNDELITLTKKAGPLLKRRIEIETEAIKDAEANSLTDAEKGRSSLIEVDQIHRNLVDFVNNGRINLQLAKINYDKGDASEEVYLNDKKVIDNVDAKANKLYDYIQKLNDPLSKLKDAKSKKDESQVKLDAAKEASDGALTEDVAKLSAKAKKADDAYNKAKREVDVIEKDINTVLKELADESPGVYTHKDDASNLSNIDKDVFVVEDAVPREQLQNIPYVDHHSGPVARAKSIFKEWIFNKDQPLEDALANIDRVLMGTQSEAKAQKYGLVDKVEHVSTQKVRAHIATLGGHTALKIKGGLIIFEEVLSILKGKAGEKTIEGAVYNEYLYGLHTLERTPLIKEGLAKLLAKAVEAKANGSKTVDLGREYKGGVDKIIKKIESRIANDRFGTGMTLDEANVIVNRVKDLPKALQDRYNLATIKFRKLIHNTQEALVDGGLQSRSTVNEWQRIFKNYAPMSGIDNPAALKSKIEAGDKVVNWVREKVLKQKPFPIEDAYAIDGDINFGPNGYEARDFIFNLKGRETIAHVDGRPYATLEQALMQNAKAHSNGANNKVGQALLDVALANPVDGGVATLWSVSEKPINNKSYKVVVNGKDMWINFKSDRIVNALKGLNQESASGLVYSLISPFAGLMRNVYTTFSAKFGVTNRFRDLPTAIYNALADNQISGVKNPKGAALEIVKTSNQNVRDLYKFFKDPNSPSIPAEKRYNLNLWEQNGGATGWGFMDPMANIFRKVDVALDPSLKGNARRTALKAKDVLMQATGLRFVEGINNAMENSVRFSVFEYMVNHGADPVIAARASKEITVNFNQSGSARGLFKSYLFLNPGIQGVGKTTKGLRVESAKNPTGKDKAWRKRFKGSHVFWGGLMSLGAAVTFVNRIVGEYEDEDGNIRNYYDEIHNKENYAVFMTGNKDEHFSLPIAYTLGMAYDMGRISMEDTEWADKSVDLMNSFIRNFSPRSLGGGDDKTLGESFTNVAIPDGWKPYWQLKENKNYWGSRIIQDEKKYMLDGSSKQVELNQTYILGDNSYGAELFNLILTDSPYSIEETSWAGDPYTLDHLFKAYTGSTGQLYQEIGGAIISYEDALSAYAEIGDHAKFMDTYQLIDATDFDFANFIYKGPNTGGNFNLSSEFYETSRRLNNASEYIGTLSDKELIENYGMNSEQIGLAQSFTEKARGESYQLQDVKESVKNILGAFILEEGFPVLSGGTATEREEGQRVILTNKQRDLLKQTMAMAYVSDVVSETEMSANSALKIIMQAIDNPEKAIDDYDWQYFFLAKQIIMDGLNVRIDNSKADALEELNTNIKLNKEDNLFRDLNIHDTKLD